MKKKTKYLDFYKEWMELGRLPYAGLCYSLEDDPMLDDMFKPEGADSITQYWANTSSNSVSFLEFNPLRQNIVLLLAAINDEL